LDLQSWQLSRPSLVFSPCSLIKFRPAGGKIFAGRPVDKVEQVRRLQLAHIPTPRTLQLIPGMSLDPAVWGEYVVVKPTMGLTSYGRSLRLARPKELGARFLELTGNGREKMLVQELIDTTNEAGRLFAYRVLTMFGHPLYANTNTQTARRPPLAEIHDQGSNVLAHNAKGIRRTGELIDDPDVLELAKQAAKAFTELPVLGLDIVRERATGDLYVLETNSGGYVWHLSSDVIGRRQPQKAQRKKYNQFRALDIAADALIEKTRKEASRFAS
jgi:glutathione synthase/RimK-type ligase-like ATP-grasp enzyme